jgi:hypothetical protein
VGTSRAARRSSSAPRPSAWICVQRVVWNPADVISPSNVTPLASTRGGHPTRRPAGPRRKPAP